MVYETQCMNISGVHQVDPVFPDFSKAFDTVNHLLLTVKVKASLWLLPNCIVCSLLATLIVNVVVFDLVYI